MIFHHHDVVDIIYSDSLQTSGGGVSVSVSVSSRFDAKMSATSPDTVYSSRRSEATLASGTDVGLQHVGGPLGLTSNSSAVGVPWLKAFVTKFLMILAA